MTGGKPALGSTLPASLNCIANSASINTRTDLFKSKLLGQKMSQRAVRGPRDLGLSQSLAEGLGKSGPRPDRHKLSQLHCSEFGILGT